MSTWRWNVPFTLTQHKCNINILGFVLLPLEHLVHQTCRHVFHSQFFHWHHFQGRNQVFIWGLQVFRQSHDNFFVSHKYLRASLPTNALTLLMWSNKPSPSCIFYVKNFMINEKHVGKIPRRIDIAKGLICLH